MNWYLVLFTVFINGCSNIPTMQDSCTTGFMKTFAECIEPPTIIQLPTYEQLLKIPPADVMPVVAVYKFGDLTGQRKQKDNTAMFSTAVTQGSHTMLIDALKTAANGKWFRVVERVGVDHLTRERQIIRSTRKDFNQDAADIQPLLFAGIILEGGIIGYDSNIKTGGRGARYLGIGGSTAYRRDIVTVSLRAVSTLTGEVLLNVQTSKTILSVASGYDVFKFIDMDTKLIEIEDGITENESVTRSVRSSIEAAVYELIYQGHDRSYWTLNPGHRHPHQENGTNEKHLTTGTHKHE